MKTDTPRTGRDSVSGIYWMAALLLICVCWWLLLMPDIEWTIALNGFSPIDWVAHLDSPENFRRDFPNGSTNYDKSSFMHVYPLASSWLGISPEQLIKWVVLLEIIFLVSCAMIFSRALTPSAPPVVAFVFALLLVSGRTNMDLSNFGRPTFWGLYYNAADALRLLGIAQFLRGRILTSSILLAASLTIHPVMALTACIFVAGFLVAWPAAVPRRRLSVAVVVFLGIAGGWWFWKMAGVTLSSGTLDPTTWIAIVRAFTYHLFPVDYGFLTVYHDYRLLPLVCLSALAAGYLPLLEKDRQRRKAIVMGIAFLVFATAAGVWISVYLPQPALIKLALQRASDMILIVTLGVAVAGLVGHVVKSQSLWERALAMAILVSPFLMKPGFAALPVVLILVACARDPVYAGSGVWRHRASYLFGVLVVALAALYASTGVLEWRHLPAYLGSLRFWEFTVAAGGISYLLRLRPSRHPNTSAPILIALVLGLLFGYSQWRAVPEDEGRRLGRDYLETQRWAKGQTPPAALFLVDPTIYYGWRDFSTRSSFGNVREWLYASWLYDSKVEVYLEGLRRFDEFDLKLGDYLNEKPSIDGFNKLDRDLKNRFYEMEPDRLADIGQRNGADYLVMKRSLIRKAYPFERVFQNRSFVIYRLAGGR